MKVITVRSQIRELPAKLKRACELFELLKDAPPEAGVCVVYDGGCAAATARSVVVEDGIVYISDEEDHAYGSKH